MGGAVRQELIKLRCVNGFVGCSEGRPERMVYSPIIEIKNKYI